MIFEKIHLEEDEKILITVRRHWFYLFKQMFFVTLLALLPLIIFWLSTLFLPEFVVSMMQGMGSQTVFLYALWLLINWMLAASLWTEYYLDTWTITNKRVIKINQQSLFKRQIGSFRLERLQDTNIEISGLIATLLDFGTIDVQTASGHSGHGEAFKASYIPKPRELKAMILKVSDELHKNTSSTNQIP